MRTNKSGLWIIVGAFAFGVLLPAAGNLNAAQPPVGKPVVNADIVELFAAMAAGDVEAKVIPKDSTNATVLITNKTDRPLAIKLPEAFAGVPALAQFGGGQGGQGGFGGNQQGGMNQGMGGGMGGMGGGGMGGGGGGFGGQGGGGGGFFNVAAEKVGKIKVVTICLEHGKADPRPRIPYTLKPLEEFNDDPHVYEVCSMLGHGEIDQRAAQVAAWHFTDAMSFEELAAKRIKHLNGTSEPYFAHAEVVRAVQIVRESVRRADQRSTILKQDESLSRN